MKWFRFYHEVLDDPKVQRLPADLFKTWVNLLCVASKNGGHITADYDELSFILRTTPEKVGEAIDALLNAGLLDQGETLHPHNWTLRQYESDDSSGRVKRHRERERNGDVTASVTPPEQNRPDSEQNRTEARRAWFSRFWKAYPRKQDKGHAEKAFDRACKTADPEAVIAACEKYRWPEDKQFIPLPATWLNGRRWEDEQSSPAANGHAPIDEDAAWRAKAKSYAAMLEKGISLGMSASDNDIRRMVRERIIPRELAERRGYSL